MLHFVLIAVFGVLGVLLRYFIGLAFARYWPGDFPFHTLFINILGSFLIGLIYVAGIERGIITQDVKVGLMVGFLGGFTTFSAFSLESVLLVERGLLFNFAAYVLSSAVFGLVAACVGLMAGRFFWPNG